jgi:hypothetical protein
MSCQQVVAWFKTAERRGVVAQRDALQIARVAALNDPQPYLDLLENLNERAGD